MPIIGALRHQVAVQNPTRTPDGDGGYTESYAASSPSPVWAEIVPATPSAIERVAGNTIEAPVTHIVTIRTHSGVTTKTRLVFGSRTFFVRGIQRVNEVTEWMVLSCEEFLG